MIRDKYGDRVKVVVFNITDDDVINGAYRQTGSPSVGFDVAGTPFEDSANGAECDGMIWHVGFEDWILKVGVDGIADDYKRTHELKRRFDIVLPDNNLSDEQVGRLYGVCRKVNR